MSEKLKQLPTFLFLTAVDVVAKVAGVLADFLPKPRATAPTGQPVHRPSFQEEDILRPVDMSFVPTPSPILLTVEGLMEKFPSNNLDSGMRLKWRPGPARQIPYDQPRCQLTLFKHVGPIESPERIVRSLKEHGHEGANIELAVSWTDARPPVGRRTYYVPGSTVLTADGEELALFFSPAKDGGWRLHVAPGPDAYFFLCVLGIPCLDGS